MMIEPGKPVMLPTDRADAEDILTVVRVLNGVRDILGASILGRVLKEFLWAKWERPRLPKPLVDGKYPYAYPWSARARAAWHASPRRAGRPAALVIEHVVPKRELLNEIAANATELDVDELLALLRGAHAAVVLSKEEDAQVTAAGFGYASPDASDVWARYRAAGLDLAGFGPLTTS